MYSSHYLMLNRTMKIFYAMLGVTALSVSAVAFSRRAAPIAVRRSIVAYATPAEFAKNEIASNDVSVLLAQGEQKIVYSAIRML